MYKNKDYAVIRRKINNYDTYITKGGNYFIIFLDPLFIQWRGILFNKNGFIRFTDEQESLYLDSILEKVNLDVIVYRKDNFNFEWGGKWKDYYCIVLNRKKIIISEEIDDDFF